MKSIIIPADKESIYWNEVVKKEARGIDDADFGEVQMTMGDTVITEKGVTDKKRFYLPKSLVDKIDGHTLWFRTTEDEAYNTYRSVEEIL
ncbi:MAG: hypothetical protein ACJ71R_03570 [Nitrososphaeraceae archaeon]